MKLEELDPMSRLMCLFIGKPGSGKSVAIGSFPRPLYIYDFDGRIRALANFLGQKNTEGIEYGSYSADNFLEFKRHFESLQNDNKYKTVAISSLTTLANSAIRHIIKSRGRAGKIIGGYSVSDLEDYGGEDAIIKTILEIAKTLTCNFIIEAHIMVWPEKDPKTNTSVMMSQLVTGGKKVAAVIPAYFDELYTFQQEVAILSGEAPKYKVYPYGDSAYPGKTMLKLPASIDQTGGKFYDTLMKHVKDNNVELIKL